MNYLSKSLVEHQMLHKSEELTEETFVGQVYLSKKVKYIIAFIYNTYRLWMSIRIDRKKEIYSLHQLPEGGMESTDSNSLEVALKELRKETKLRVHYS